MAVKSDSLVDRYVYAVVRHLPASQREDVDRELRSVVDDMLSSRGADGVESVLEELGPPWALADNYRGSRRCLIGPDNYDLYLLVLKIATGATALGIVIALLIGYLANPAMQSGLSRGPVALESVVDGAVRTAELVAATIGDVVLKVFGAIVQTFAWVTISFAIAEYFQVRSGEKHRRTWHPADLPSVPVESTRFSRGESIASIIFLMVFFVLINASPALFGIGSFTGASVRSVWIIPVFDPQVFRRMLVLVDISIVLQMCVEFAKLWYGRYSAKASVLMIAINSVSLMLFVYVVGFSNIWNPTFTKDLGDLGIVGPQVLQSVERFWNMFPTVLMVVMIVGFVVGTGTTVYRTWIAGSGDR